MQVPSLEHDRRLLDEFLELLPSGGDAVRFLRHHNMGDAFNRSQIAPLKEFIQTWDNAEHVFLDEELEDARQTVLARVAQLYSSIGANTSPTDVDFELRRVPTGWRDTRPEEWNNLVKQLNGEAASAFEAHQALVLLGKRKLNPGYNPRSLTRDEAPEAKPQTDRASISAFGAKLEGPTRVVLLVLAVGVVFAVFWFWEEITDRLPAGFSGQAPQLTSPANGSTLSGFPGNLKIEWKALDGAQRYIVEIEVRDPETRDWLPHPGFSRVSATETSASIKFNQSRSGRWRVQAIDGSGIKSRYSDWWEFFLLETLPPTPKSTNAPRSDTVAIVSFSSHQQVTFFNDSNEVAHVVQVSMTIHVYGDDGNHHASFSVLPIGIDLAPGTYQQKRLGKSVHFDLATETEWNQYKRTGRFPGMFFQVYDPENPVVLLAREASIGTLDAEVSIDYAIGADKKSDKLKFVALPYVKKSIQ